MYLRKLKTNSKFQLMKNHAVLFCINDNDKVCLVSSLKMLTIHHCSTEKIYFGCVSLFTVSTENL